MGDYESTYDKEYLHTPSTMVTEHLNWERQYIAERSLHQRMMQEVIKQHTHTGNTAHGIHKDEAFGSRPR